MKYLTYAFPLAVLAFIGVAFMGLSYPGNCPLDRGKDKRIGKRDLAAVLIILILYTPIAFFRLGDTQAPQSFRHFSACESVTVDLGGVYTIDELLYYSGLCSGGGYDLSVSSDGVNFDRVAFLEQKHSSLFKWNKAEFYADREPSGRYFRLTANREQYLGELAIRSGGVLISGSGQLFDEQELAPAYPDYLNGSVFDEVYHARTAYENVEGVYPYELSHPPLGKLIISVGIRLFGMVPFGWRFSGTLFGVLMLPILYVLIKKLFGGIAVPFCGTLIFAFDFMHFTQTRLATVDTYAVFFILLMYLFMYLYLSGGRLANLALSGVFFGVGVACKWTCFYAGAGLAVLWLIHWLRRFELKSFMKNVLFCLCFFVLVPAIIYYVSYIPYGQAKGMSGFGMLFSKDYAGLVIDNQRFMFTYHSGVHSEHPYSSRWYQWVFDVRPILYYLKYFDDGTRSSFGAFVNPLICWGGLVAMLLTAYLAFFRKDRISEFILTGYLAQLLPWVFITRTTFEYHYFPASVFLVLAICRVFSLVRDTKLDRCISVYGFTGVSCLLFAVFYPVLSGATVNAQLFRSLLKWLPTWPF